MSNHTAQKPSLARLVPVLCLSAASILACGQPGSAPGDAASGEGSAPRFLSLGTAPPGGAFFVVGGALAEVAGAHGGWNVSAEATKGSRENIRRLAQGELDFALSNAAITYFAVRGEAGWDRPYAMRSVMTLAPNVALFITPADSGITSIADLPGKRVVVGPAGAGFEMFVAPITEAHGVSYDDFTPLNATQAGAVDMLSDRSADVAFLGGAVPTASITQAATSIELRYLPFDARDRLIADYPFFHAATIPAGTYRGQAEDFAGLNVGSMHLITAESTSEELVYAFTKAIYENRQEVVARHPAGRAIQPANVVREVGTPFHPGAIRYYREIGVWSDAETPAETAGDETAEGETAAGEATEGETAAGETAEGETAG